MKKITLKKSLQVVLENSKQAIIKTIAETMRKYPPTENEVSWLLLEFTLEYPFPPTLGLAQVGEFDVDVETSEHPLMCYNAPDLELFSEDDTIVIDFSKYDDLFDTAHDLLEEIEYEDRQPFIFELYVAVCKALMEDPTVWENMKLAKDFHVTARDFEQCDEEDFLKALLPKAQFNKLKKKIDAYEKQAKDEYDQDETVLNVKSIVEREAVKYDTLLEALNKIECTDVYAHEEFYFLRPYHVEKSFHKLPEQLEIELSTEQPKGLYSYFHYKFNNNIPQCVDAYFEDKIVWRKIYQYNEGQVTSHKFYLKTDVPEFEDYTELRYTAGVPTFYAKYMSGHLDEINYTYNEQGQLTYEMYNRSMFDVGYKMDAQFESFYEYKNDILSKISTRNQLGHSTVVYCIDESFMKTAIDDFVDHICDFAITKMKEVSLDGVSMVVLEHELDLPFYFKIILFKEEEMIDLSTYELYEDNSAMMNLTMYTSQGLSAKHTEYFSVEKAQEYINTTYQVLSLTLADRINDELNCSLKVICKSTYDEID